MYVFHVASLPVFQKTTYLERTRKNNIFLLIILSFLLIHVILFLQFYEIQQREHKARRNTGLLYFSNLTRFHVVRPEELRFPLAYSILVHNYPDRVIRLLRAIHRPQNEYCIHVDRRSPPDFIETLRQEARHLGENIQFVPDEQRVEVIWGTMSVLEPEMQCARLLLRTARRWKYWINLTGHEFPLRTNWELVRALTALNGSNVVEAAYTHRQQFRIPPSHYLNFNVTWYKGGVHVALRREFVEYMLTNPKAIQLYQALEHYERSGPFPRFPDETFFATLNHNPEVFSIPGSFLGTHEENVSTLLTRAKIWSYDRLPCSTNHWRRMICIYGVNDLPFLFKHPHFFANKFLPTVEPLGYDLLEMWFAGKIHYEMATQKLHPSFNLSFYETHPFALYHM